MHHIISNSSDLQRSRRRTRNVAGCSCAIALLSFVQLLVTSAAAEEYADRIRPLLATYCLECHSTKVQEAGFDIQRFATLGEVRANLEAWQEMLDMLQREEMPPEGEPQPKPQERQQLITWIQSFLESGEIEPFDDPDLDGLTNLMEYALGGNPVSVGDRPPVEVSKDGVFSGQISAEQVATTVVFESSLDLQTWVEFTPSFEDNGPLRSWEWSDPEQTRSFVRLRVVINP